MSNEHTMPLEALAGWRVGSVPYLNSVPLTHGIAEQVVFAPPSQLAGMLRNGTLDAALVSITEALLHPGYRILDGVAVASDGPVMSVCLASKVPLEAIEVVHCDPASLTSINLLKVLLQEKGIQPRWQPLTDYPSAHDKEAVLLIGDAAITFQQSRPPHRIWDLGAAWKTLTGLPFVYAVWAIRQGCDDLALLNILSQAKARGSQEIAVLVAEESRFDHDFRVAYLGKAIRYELGEREKAGIDLFIDKLSSVLKQPVFPPRYVAAQPLPV
ncbi:MAG: menaquinone biosynthesis protein [Verrucomicrobiota bacterium]|nr:menaquinone biosynthesis protein [Verrucomicrobiota bacterium]